MGSDKMQSKKTGNIFRIIVFSLTAFMIGFAFYHSSMSAADSTVESEGVLDIIIKFFSGFGLPLELTDHIIRKLAHFSEYFVIGGLMLSCAYSFDRFKPYRFLVHVLFAGLLTAVIDETIQLFPAGRSGQITDVLLDFSGIFCGAFVLLLFYLIYIKLRYKSEKKVEYGKSKGSSKGE